MKYSFHRKAMTDITEYDEPNILFFRGVFPEKYDIESMFTHKIMDSLRITEGIEVDLADEIRTYTMFDKIPRVFSTIDTWPKSTNIQCWWCNRVFKEMPKFIPSGIVNNGDMATYGNFCSFFCAAVHIDVFLDPKIRWERHQMLKILHVKMTGMHVDYIPRSPVPFTMLQYGGGSDSGDVYGKKLIALSQSMTTYANSPVLSSLQTGMPPPDLGKHI